MHNPKNNFRNLLLVIFATVALGLVVNFWPELSKPRAKAPSSEVVAVIRGYSPEYNFFALELEDRSRVRVKIVGGAANWAVGEEVVFDKIKGPVMESIQAPGKRATLVVF